MNCVTIILKTEVELIDGGTKWVQPLEQYDLVSKSKKKVFFEEHNRFMIMDNYLVKDSDDNHFYINVPDAIQDDKRQKGTLDKRYKEFERWNINNTGDFEKKVLEAIGHDIRAMDKADHNGKNLIFKRREFKYIDFLEEWL